MDTVLVSTLTWSLTQPGWLVSDLFALTLIIIAWPYRTPKNLDDPAYYLWSSWRMIPLVLGILISINAVARAFESGQMIAVLASLTLLIAILLGLIVSPRGKHFIAKSMRPRK